MGSRSVRVVVLCEDKQQFTFAYRCLKRLGFGPRDIQPQYAALGRTGGAGEQYVRTRYPVEVRALRRRRAASALLAVIDADTTSVAHRERQLRAALATANPPEPPRRKKEAIGHWIPRRNIETWIHFLLGRPVNEDDPFPKLTGHERDCDPAAARLAVAVVDAKPLGRDAPGSLRHGVVETRRLLRT